MNQFNLTAEEDLHLRFSIMLSNRRSLYEYLLELPLEDLKEYPEKGYHRWMGQAARSPQALALRDYILYWRFAALTFRQKYPREYLEELSRDDLTLFLHTYIQKVPIWVYEKPIKDVIQLCAPLSDTNDFSQ